MTTMTYEVFETQQEAVKNLAAEVAELIRSRAAEGKGVVLGLATGASPLGFYAELIRLHKEEGTQLFLALCMSDGGDAV